MQTRGNDGSNRCRLATLDPDTLQFVLELVTQDVTSLGTPLPRSDDIRNAMIFFRKDKQMEGSLERAMNQLVNEMKLLESVNDKVVWTNKVTSVKALKGMSACDIMTLWCNEEERLLTPSLSRQSRILYHKPSALAFVQRHPSIQHLMRYAPPETRADSEVMAAVMEQTPDALLYASPELKGSRDFVRPYVTKDPAVLLYAADNLKEDPEFMCPLIMENTKVLTYAPPEMRDDRIFMEIIMARHPEAMYYASIELRNNADFVLPIVRRMGSMLYFVSEELKDNREVVLAAVTQYGLVLEKASERLKADPEVVLAAVTQCGKALKYAPANLQRGIVRALSVKR